MEFPLNPDNVVDVGQMKDDNQEIEKKVERILKLIKNNGQDKNDEIPEDLKESELIGLIHEFHKQYQSLYAQYDNLRGDIGERARGQKEKENPSSSPSSDSEYYSSEDIETNGHNRSSHSFEAEADADEGNPEESANLKYMTAFGKSPKAKITRKEHRNKGHERKRELSTLVKVEEGHGSRASAEIKEFEGQLTMLRMELDSVHSVKEGLEVKIEEKETEMKQIEETNVQLLARISELEVMSEEKGNAISAMTEKMKENEKNLTSRIQVLTTQVKDLQLEIDYLQAEKSEMVGDKRSKKSVKFKGLKDQTKNMQKELESVRGEKNELQLQLDMKINEITENLKQIEALKDGIARKNDEEQGFIVQIDGLKSEVNSLHDQNNELEEIIRSKNKEIDQLREEKGRLENRILEVERSLADAIEKSNASAQIMVLKAQVDSLQQELDSLASEKNLLEEQNDRLKQDSAQNQIQVENEILNLTSKIEDQQKTLQEKDETIKKLNEDSKWIKQLSLDSPRQRSTPESPKYRSMDSGKLNYNYLERKIDELADKFQMKTENQIRLLARRIRVAEQLHTESGDSYKKVLEKLEQENKELNEKKTARESEAKKMKDMLLESGGNMLTGFDMMIKKIDDENGKFLNRISGISSELQVARNCLAGKSDRIIKKLKHSMETEEAISDGDTKPNAASEINTKVEDLEQKLLEKDEEKREAIRQLCELIEYHRQRYDHLKEAVSKMPIRFRKPT